MLGRQHLSVNRIPHARRGTNRELRKASMGCRRNAARPGARNSCQGNHLALGGDSGCGGEYRKREFVRSLLCVCAKFAIGCAFHGCARLRLIVDLLAPSAAEDFLLRSRRSVSISDRRLPPPSSRKELNRLRARAWQETMGEIPTASQAGEPSRLR